MPAHKENNGSWSIEFYYKDAFGKRHRKHKRGFAYKKDALKFESDFKAKLINNPSIPFKAFIQDFYEYHKARVTEGTHNHCVYLIERFILPLFKDVALGDITVKMVIKWQDDLTLNNNYKPTYIYSINSKFNLVMKYTMRCQGLLLNPVEAAGKIGMARAMHNEFWTIEQFNKFINALTDKNLNKENKIKRKVDDESLIVGFNILFYVGLRISELLNLKVNNVTIMGNNAILSIIKSKSKSGIRSIELPKTVTKLLVDYISSFPLNYPPSESLFPTLKRDNVRRALNSGAKLAGLNHIRVHDLRHSHATLLYKLSVPIKVASVRLGHARVSTTLDTYTHIAHNDTNEVSNKLDQAIAEKTVNNSVTPI